MPNSFFKFKEFTIYQEKCAMKVGTDGVLLGAWAEVSTARRILDVGTGTGVIALMLAQRSGAFVTGIDIDPPAVKQAGENMANSPWASRTRAELIDVRQLAQEEECRYEAIVSNPPYFTESVGCPDGRRHAARHTDSLTFEELLEAADRLLTKDGRLSVILPADSAKDFIAFSVRHHLFLERQTWVHTKPGVPPKRVLMAFGRTLADCRTEHLPIRLDKQVYSPEYAALTRDFYLSV